MSYMIRWADDTIWTGYTEREEAEAHVEWYGPREKHMTGTVVKVTKGTS